MLLNRTLEYLLLVMGANLRHTEVTSIKGNTTRYVLVRMFLTYSYPAQDRGMRGNRSLLDIYISHRRDTKIKTPQSCKLQEMMKKTSMTCGVRKGFKTSSGTNSRRNFTRTVETDVVAIQVP